MPFPMHRLPTLTLLAALAAPGAVAHALPCPPEVGDVHAKCDDALLPGMLLSVDKGSAEAKAFLLAPADGSAATLGRLVVAKAPVVAVPTLRAGESLRGSLSTSDATLEDDSHADLYRLVGTPGTRYTVTLRSEDFDAYLAVGTTAAESDVSSLDVMSSNDDGAGGTDARVTFTMPEGGDPVYARANSLGEGETGAYTVSMEEAPPLRAPSTAPIRVGQSVEGRLDEGDGQLPDESFADDYTFAARAGQTYEVVMTSDDFDAFLMVGTGTGDAFESTESNDDGDGESDGTNARLVFTAERSGPMTIRANSLGNGEVGAYTLRLVQK